MKFLPVIVNAFVEDREARRNMRALFKYFVALGVVIAVFSVVFHFLMAYEGQQHSWLTGMYWTLTVMSTLGFGDITFHSDPGRAFSVIVLLTGIFMLMIVLPFAFIRYFYAPWLDAQHRLKAPRSVPDSVSGHIIVCSLQGIGHELVQALTARGLRYVVIEPDTKQAVAHHADGINTVVGDLDSVDTWRAVGAERAALVVANCDDATNTVITITVREVAPDVPLVAFTEDMDAVDILELSGASHVVPLKHRLGEQLAARVSAGNIDVHEIGRLDDLVIAEFPVHNTAWVGRTIRDTQLRELTGLSIVAYWNRGKLLPARPDAVLTDYCAAVVVGSQGQLDDLRSMLAIYQTNVRAIVVLGGGKVGRAVIRGLKRRGLTVHVVEEDPALKPMLERLADLVVIGDAANIEVMNEVAIDKAPSVVLTTHNDAVNIYLAVYARRLNPKAHIVSRVMRVRNLDAMHRAGANTVLGESALGTKSVLSVLQNRELVFVGEEVELFVVDVPQALIGQTLAASGIGACP